MTPIETLTALPDPQGRIDAVADDILSGARVFAAIPAWDLGALLGLRWDSLPAKGTTWTLLPRDGAPAFGFASICLEARNGLQLHFEARVDEADALSDPKGPYDEDDWLDVTDYERA